MTPAQRANVVPRVVLFGGKAAPGYAIAKMIIKLINNVAEVVNRDAAIDNLLKVYFLADYNVSLAEVAIPASDISQHISTAGTEASGTSNMKFAMNGGLILGTLDGANIEIREEIGTANMFIFGATADQVEGLRRRGGAIPIDERLYQVLRAIQTDVFGNHAEFAMLIDPLWNGNDHYLVAHDFASYLEQQDQIDACYKDQIKWLKMTIVSTMSMGKFSSDRTIDEYARDIWNIQPQRLPDLPEGTVFKGVASHTDMSGRGLSPNLAAVGNSLLVPN